MLYICMLNCFMCFHDHVCANWLGWLIIQKWNLIHNMSSYVAQHTTHTAGLVCVLCVRICFLLSVWASCWGLIDYSHSCCALLLKSNTCCVRYKDISLFTLRSMRTWTWIGIVCISIAYISHKIYINRICIERFILIVVQHKTLLLCFFCILLWHLFHYISYNVYLCVFVFNGAF